MTSCRELDSNRSALSAASAFAIATAGANEGTPNKEKYRRMSLASAGTGDRSRLVMTAVAPGACPPSNVERLLPQGLLCAEPPAWRTLPPHPPRLLLQTSARSQAHCPREARPSPPPPTTTTLILQRRGPGGLWSSVALSGEAARRLQQPLKGAEVRERRDCVHREVVTSSLTGQNLGWLSHIFSSPAHSPPASSHAGQPDFPRSGL